MKSLYPKIEPYRIHSIEVDNHQIYLEECGNPSGIPVIFLHGGPASGCKPDHRQMFDPKKYRVILFDQRGCGRSSPHGELTNNTTQKLIDDMEHFRIALGIERWLLFGGSWGATLALLYAQKFPRNVSAMILRGVFLARLVDYQWFLKEGVNRIYPEQWQNLINAIPALNDSDLIGAMDRALMGNDELGKHRLAKAWDAWGGQVALGNEYDANSAKEPLTAEVFRRIKVEIHYAKNRYFIENNQILDQSEQLPDVPVTLIHGRNDLVCPAESAFSLHHRLPNAELIVLPNSGHVARGDEMLDALIRATDNMAEKLAR